MLRIALVGAGRTVTIGHAPALQALHDLYQVVAIADQSREALDNAGILLAVPPGKRYIDYREMLQQGDIDAVSVTLPHAFHREVTIDALNAGLNVITERPIALSTSDAEEIIRLAEQKNKHVIVLHYYLYYPPFREAIRTVSDGSIGEPFFARCEGVTGGYGPGTASYHPDWHADPEISGGGVWLDSGYHSAYLCVSLLGARVEAVGARTANYTTGLQVDDTAAAQLYHANGGVSSVQAAWSVPSGGSRVFEVYGTEGSIVIDHDGYPLGIYSNKTQTWHHVNLAPTRDESFTDLYKAISDCLGYGAPVPVSHQDALHTLEIVMAGYRANSERSVVSVKSFETGMGSEAERNAA